MEMPKNLKNEFSKEVKLRVLTEALKITESNKDDVMFGIRPDDDFSFGLCLLLPSIAFNRHFLDSLDDGSGWVYDDTIIAFPELKKWLPEIEESIGRGRKEIRIKAIKSMIQEIESV